MLFKEVIPEPYETPINTECESFVLIKQAVLPLRRSVFRGKVKNALYWYRSYWQQGDDCSFRQVLVSDHVALGDK
jgi:hypothetical protein